MKTIIGSIFTLIFFSTGAFAQSKVTDKATFKTPQVQCEECKAYIEERMIREYGIISVNGNYQKKTTTVSWYTDRTTAENIKVIFSYLGFDADDVTADEIAFKKLPACCKKPAPAPKTLPKLDSIRPVPPVVMIKDTIRPVLIQKMDTPKQKNKPALKLNRAN